ncbi:Nn.00g090150.m01.CDS01 [Neocucurbitaria sp. VM-36]
MSATITDTSVPLTSSRTYTSILSPDELFKYINQTLRPYKIKSSDLQDIMTIFKGAIASQPLPSDMRSIPIKSKSRSRHRHKPEHRPTRDFSSIVASAGIHKNYTHGRVQKYACLPESVTQSFYFHHTDPLFPEIFPHADLSTYESPKANEQAKRDDDGTTLKDTSLPSILISAPESAPAAEVPEDVKPVHDATVETQVKVEEDERMVMGFDIAHNEEPLVVASPPRDNEAAVQFDQSAVLDNVPYNDHSDIVLQNETKPAVDIEAYINPLDERNYPVESRNMQDTVDTSQQDDFVFSQPDLSTQFTDSTYGTLPSESYPQEHNNAWQASTSPRPETSRPKLRRSLRLAKAKPTPLTVASFTSSSLGKHSRRSNGADDEPARKKSKSSG